jgi:hypothetical protein
MSKTNKLLRGCLLILLVCGIFPLQAQQLRSTFPIQVSAFLPPPYSLYLSDYGGSSGRETVALTLLNRDLQEAQVDVRLHVAIHAGSNLQLETKDQNVLPTFRLFSGAPVKLSQDELSPYFSLENLSVTGAFSGRFPEGMLEICFSVYEVHTGRQKPSTSACLPKQERRT